MPNTSHALSIDPQEVEKFSKMAESWWDETGAFAPLHRFNPVRIAYICNQIKASGLAPQGVPPQNALSGLKLLDVGCGGGLLSEPMARLGATVTGIDASEKNIAVASHHAKEVGLVIDYRATSAESLADTGQQFDVVLAMEIIEHVADVESFLTSCTRLVKPGGLLFVATMNRTVKSYMLAIVGAEYILRWLPKGTHDWKKFLKPSEIASTLRHEGMALQAVQGVGYNLLDSTWHLVNDTGVNYILSARK
ncbi:MAG: ubiG [Rickettsiales bacterium]|jgi:2-polyprenyl-6-hydroxyphenyl methylase/3-demethylubiquinone-9 3-methyltransferase|nr:ubiG [Rickettsiales bacterium]